MTNEIDTILKDFDEKIDDIWDDIPDLAKDDIKSFISSHLAELLQGLILEIEGEKKMGGEFGFCEHCKFHKGDYEHDHGTCNAYDSALNLAQTKLRELIK